MRNYIILNGKNSNEINGLLIQELPPISKPLIRTEVEEIDGRDGDIVTPLGYSAYDKEFTIGLYKDFDVNEVAAYFNSEGTVIFSNEPDKYYYYQITAQIDFERLVRYRTATVTMHCQPFKYSATEQPITEDVSGTVSDEGTNLALENTAEAPFNTLDLKGNTSQQTYMGKNLLNLGPKSDGGVAGAITNGSTITVTGTALATDGRSVAELQTTLQAGTYTLTIDHAATHVINLTVNTSDGNVAFRLAAGETSITRTLASASTGGNVFWAITQGQAYNETFKLQLVAGATADYNYEPYVGGVPAPNPDYPQAVKVVTGENVVKVTGKNILKPSENLHASRNGLTNVVNDDGSITTSGKPTVNWNAIVYPTVDITDRLEDGATYTLSQQVKTNKLYLQVNVRNKNTGTTQYIALDNATSASFTVDKSLYTYYYIIQSPQMTTWGDDALTITNYYQLEKSSQATDWEAYQEQSYPISLGSIELCRLTDDHKDHIFKNADKWYKHKEIGKYVLNGASGENWYISGQSLKCNSLNALGYPYMSSEYAFNSRLTTQLYSNYGLVVPSVSVFDGTASGVGLGNKDGGGGTTDAIYVSKGSITAVEDWRALLTATPLICYYVLRTPVDEEITDSTLIEQLNNIYYHAHAYKGRTHITSSAATGNVPHIIAAEVGEDNESTITNAGNYLSKPKITVYGSGDISLYINDMHVLQITLGDEGYITIDTAQMEAYKDTLDNLKNRLVIGDYSNARLKPGANKIHFTGTVTKYIVENYSRWL